MKVSRTVINSALTELASIGFVDIVPRHGVYVADYIRNGNIETLIEIIHFKKGRLDKRTFNALIDYRYQTEVECAALAASNRTEKDLLNLKDLLRKIETEDDYIKIAQLKVDFHHIIYCATGNIVYPMVYNSFKQISLKFNELMYKHYNTSAGTDFLYDLVDALEAKDSNKAHQIMSDLVAARVTDLKDYYFDEPTE